ncbi:MAG: NADAR domain-containing protein [Dehalococcoidia bacterium]|nr:NADAR domain-containing protein [Dehalococcoidia bacterium]
MADSTRTYDPKDSSVFRRTRDQWGTLSNFAPASIEVNGLRAHHSEALYQAARFPRRDDIQKMVCAQRNPMASKRIAHRHMRLTRTDWRKINVSAMRWTLRVRLLQNREDFGAELLATGDMPIVEYSKRDDFWGANYNPEGLLVGTNALGRLLMELREQMQNDPESLKKVAPPRIPGFMINGRIVGEIDPDQPPRGTTVNEHGMIVNVRTGASYDIFVGRGSRLGNPYPIKAKTTRTIALSLYET